jgi:hypothetical protein
MVGFYWTGKKQRGALSFIFLIVYQRRRTTEPPRCAGDLFGF